MIAPSNGVYTLTEYEEVELETCTTPNTKSIRKLETAIGVGGLISGTAPLALLMALGGINVSSRVLSGIDIVNTIYDLYLQRYDEDPNSLDILIAAPDDLYTTDRYKCT